MADPCALPCPFWSGSSARFSRRVALSPSRIWCAAVRGVACDTGAVPGAEHTATKERRADRAAGAWRSTAQHLMGAPAGRTSPRDVPKGLDPFRPERNRGHKRRPGRRGHHCSSAHFARGIGFSRSTVSRMSGHGHVHVYDHPSWPYREASFALENGLRPGAPRLRCACRGITADYRPLHTGSASMAVARFWRSCVRRTSPAGI